MKVTGVAHDRNVSKITLRGVPDRPGIAAALFEPLSDVGISVDTIVQNTGVNKVTDLSFTVGPGNLHEALERVGPWRIPSLRRMFCRITPSGKVSIVGVGMLDAPGYASRMFRALAEARINIEMITTSEIRITCIVAEAQRGRSRQGPARRVPSGRSLAVVASGPSIGSLFAQSRKAKLVSTRPTITSPTSRLLRIL